MGTCTSSGKHLEEWRALGLTVIEIVGAKHLPNVDVGSLTDPYAKVCFTSSNGSSASLRTATVLNNLDPVFHSFLAFPFIPMETDLVILELMDEDVIGKDDRIGKVTIEFSKLKACIGQNFTVPIVLHRNLRSMDGGESCITLRLVNMPTDPPGKLVKDIFIIRHGESVWNDSQASMSIRGMVSQYDHELTKEGIQQAQGFNSTWKDTKALTECSDTTVDDLSAFLSAGAIFASPLTRALQTALLTCQGHPLLTSNKLLLLRNIREVKNFGSFDTVGKFTGDSILQHVQSMFQRYLGDEEAKSIMEGVRVDPYDAYGTWWTPLEVKENKDDITKRFKDLWSFLRYDTSANTIILVGHSHFFRAMLRDHMSAAFRTREPDWTQTLSDAKLSNAACMRIRVTWDPATTGPMDPPVIDAARLVFGSELVLERTKTSALRNIM